MTHPVIGSTAPHNLDPAIIIPTYNERENITSLIGAVLRRHPLAFIVVVDDSSPDKTALAVQQLENRFARVHLVQQSTKSGRGRAVLTGFGYAYRHTSAQVFVEMDADHSHQPQELARLIRQVTPQTVAIGSRYLPDSSIKYWPRYRHLFSKLTNHLIKAVLKLPLQDNTNGFRAYPREAVAVLLQHTPRCNSYLALSESALQLHQRGFTLREVATEFINRRRGSSNTTWSEVWQNLQELWLLKQTVGRRSTTP